MFPVKLPNVIKPKGRINVYCPYGCRRYTVSLVNVTIATAWSTSVEVAIIR